MKSYLQKRSQFAQKVKRLKNHKRSKTFAGLLKDWCALISTEPFCKAKSSLDPRLLYDHYGDDEMVFCTEFNFNNEEYLAECCRPGEDCLADKTCFPIGMVDGAEEFAYICNDVSLGVAVLHHSDAFCADDLDELVEEEAYNNGKSLDEFVECLIPRTEKTIIGVRGDGSKWMVIEKRSKTVRCEMSLKESWEETQQFRTHSEAWDHYFQTIRDCRKQYKKLHVLGCPHELEARITMLID